ncbi:sensor domain-containing diguanylate cyclase [Xanthobacter agilis]|uniref:diguanylate cyclase n=1 Tax=Xanthobacter agilis TaxID=47492 RepID=A0ABU0LG82_XANAG|nr:sensor domain-containing diguanylate cyclase [Xanthobacter agilis]MDQ0506150.1 diguanylate cyclase (GGDEF)-like protein/PAS domain S-box-containing protein [Xanthobacter agilis]
MSESNVLDEPPLQRTAETSQYWVWQVNRNCEFSFSSSASKSLLGLSPNEVIGRPYFSLLPNIGPIDFETAFRTAVDNGSSLENLVHKTQHADGTIRILDVSGAPVRRDDGAPDGFFGVSIDITAEASDARGLLDPKTLYTEAPVALCVVNREGRYTRVNGQFARTAGLAPESIIGLPLADLSPEAAQKFESNIQIFDLGGDVAEHELKWRGRFFRMSVEPVRNAEGDIVGGSIALVDVTNYDNTIRGLTNANRRFQLLAERDYLTTLFNRRQFEKIFRMELGSARRERQPVSLLIVDVDQFKRFNDHYGHAAGDRSLREVAKALVSACSRPRDSVCRYGGEEFAIVLPGTNHAGAQVVAERVRQAVFVLDLPHEASDLGRLSVSVGGSTLERVPKIGDLTTYRQTLLMSADAALYKAKQGGRNTVRVAEISPGGA